MSHPNHATGTTTTTKIVRILACVALGVGVVYALYLYKRMVSLEKSHKEALDLLRTLRRFMESEEEIPDEVLPVEELETAVTSDDDDDDADDDDADQGTLPPPPSPSLASTPLELDADLDADADAEKPSSPVSSIPTKMKRKTKRTPKAVVFDLDSL